MTGASANTGAVTFNVNSLGALGLTKEGGAQLAAGELPAFTGVTAIYTGADFRMTGLTNPVITSLPSVTSGSVFRKNVIINGAMRIAQRGTSFAASGNAYTIDRWVYGKSGAMVHTISQDTDVPTVAQAGILHTNSLRLNLTTADTAIAAGDFCVIAQKIEGYNFQRIAQRAFTVSFWVKATLTGTYSFRAANNGLDRSYVANFTISASNTWEFKSLTVPASPSAGTWNYTNGTGLEIGIVLASGSSFNTTAGAWQTGSFLGTSSNGNGTNTGATDFRLTGFQIEPGSSATEFEMLEFTQEIYLCQHYYWKTFPYATAPAQNTGVSIGAILYKAIIAGVASNSIDVAFPALMRTTPTITFFNPQAANANWRNISAAADSGAGSSTSILNPSDRKFGAENTQVAGDGVGQYLIIHATADAEL
jgi:hypothetical protein